MDLKSFLDSYHALKNLNGSVLFALSGDIEFPIIFIQQFIALLKKQGQPVQSLACGTHNIGNIRATLETSFLGSSSLYYIKDIYQMEKKEQKKYIDYLINYDGPHHIIAALPIDTKKSTLTKIIFLPDSVNKPLFNSLALLFGKQMTTDFLDKLLKEQQAITLDQACMIISYGQVLGKNGDYKQIIQHVFNVKQSLFLLSQYFFAKEIVPFFNLWKQVEQEYPIPFWCTFWSEQIFRAYFVRYYLTNKQHAQAKSMAYRLPFSFMQKDWKKSTAQQLKNAHNCIYEIDCSFKNGNEVNVELLYLTFFYQ